MNSQFIVESNDYFYDTVAKRKIAKGHPDTQKFLDYPSEKSISNRLFTSPSNLTFCFITSWSCNLRCPFCFVLKRLKKDFKPNEFDFNQIENFINRHTEKYGNCAKTALIIGGEPLLAPDACQNVVKLANSFGMKKSITTNLSVKLGETELDILKEMDDIQVSIDGPRKLHNKARKVLRSKDNPTDANADVYGEVMKNLQLAISAGVDPNVILIASSVAPSTISDENAQDWEDFFYDLYSLGIEKSNVGIISDSSYYNAKENPKFDSFHIVQKPCCCFRYMNYFVIDNETTLKTNYFSNDPAYDLGPISSPLEEIEQKYRNMISGTMPALQDTKCLSCEALGFCWGQCLGAGQYDGKTPGDLCDQDAIIRGKNEFISSGSFLEKYKEFL